MPPDAKPSSAFASEERLRARTTHPTDLSVASTFLDILFGILLGIIVLAFPIEHLHNRSVRDLWILYPMYFGLFLKFFFHWYGIRSDIALFRTYLTNRTQVSRYLAGLATCFTYFVCIQELARWFNSVGTAEWAFRWMFGLLAAYKLIEHAVNLVSIPSMIHNLIPRSSAKAQQKEIIRKWYSKRQPKIVVFFLISFPFMAFQARMGTQYWFIGVAAYLGVEAAVETYLFRARQSVWQSLEEFEECR